MSVASSLALAAVFAGCAETTGPSILPGAGEYVIYDHMPLDGLREWEYVNDDAAIAHKRSVEMDEGREVGDDEVFTFTHFDGDDEVGSVSWSSGSIGGVQIHGYALGAEQVVFEPPLAFADDRMSPGESVETSTGGWDFVSTFESVEACPNHWTGEEWDRCLRFHLDDGDGDDSAGPWIAGDYWLVPRYGVAWFQNTGDDDTWVLSRAEWAAN